MSDRSKTVRLEFFAQIREDLGTAAESFQTECTTAAELYDELEAKYRFRSTRSVTRVAINEQLTSWESPIHDGDTVVFLTPFGGG